MNVPLRIYVASSWRNDTQPRVVAALRARGHQVHDYKDSYTDSLAASNKDSDNASSSMAGPAEDFASLRLEPARFRELLSTHPLARTLFDKDMAALQSCDACVLVLPCGKSAHLELGWAVGAGKRTVALLQGECEPDLMYRMVDHLCLSIQEVVDTLENSTNK